MGIFLKISCIPSWHTGSRFFLYSVGIIVRHERDVQGQRPREEQDEIQSRNYSRECKIQRESKKLPARDVSSASKNKRNRPKSVRFERRSSALLSKKRGGKEEKKKT